jgi:hypothetical protein
MVGINERKKREYKYDVAVAVAYTLSIRIVYTRLAPTLTFGPATSLAAQASPCLLVPLSV